MVKVIKILSLEPCYYPGSVVKGEVLVSIEEPKDYREITIKMRGLARTSWAVSTGNTTVIYSNRETIIEKICVLWSSDGAPTGNLPVGDHRFSFSIQLPDIAPPSFRGCIGSITYQLKAKIAQESVLKFSHKEKAVLEVKSPCIKVGMETPKTAELDSNITFCCCFNFGPVNITCSLPHTRFVVGETISLNIHVQNLSMKNIYIHVSLARTEFYDGKRATRTLFQNNLSVLSLQSIPVGTSASLEGHSLSIPSTLPVSVSDCSVIKVNYYLVIQAKSLLGSSDRMRVPIFITHASPQS